MTTETAKHTAIPWEVGEDWTEDDGPEIYAGEQRICYISLSCDALEIEANAAFIVRACNSHDALLEACEVLIAELSIGDEGQRDMEGAIQSIRSAIDIGKG